MAKRTALNSGYKQQSQVSCLINFLLEKIEKKILALLLCHNAFYTVDMFVMNMITNL